MFCDNMIHPSPKKISVNRFFVGGCRHNDGKFFFADRNSYAAECEPWGVHEKRALKLFEVLGC